MQKCVCEQQKGLADNAYFIVFAYIAAFLPLAVIYALDFITDKWRSIHKTRRDGLVHLITSIPPMGYLIAYAHVQRKSEDFKEMMTAITAVLFCIFHVSRTIWGLVQLQNFRRWNIRALRCIVRLGYQVPVYGYPENEQKKAWHRRFIESLRWNRTPASRSANDGRHTSNQSASDSATKEAPPSIPSTLGPRSSNHAESSITTAGTSPSGQSTRRQSISNQSEVSGSDSVPPNQAHHRYLRSVSSWLTRFKLFQRLPFFQSPAQDIEEQSESIVFTYDASPFRHASEGRNNSNQSASDSAPYGATPSSGGGRTSNHTESCKITSDASPPGQSTRPQSISTQSEVSTISSFFFPDWDYERNANISIACLACGVCAGPRSPSKRNMTLRNLKRLFTSKKLVGLKFNLSEAQIEDTIDYHMVVNNSLIDNEFTHAEIPCQAQVLPFLRALGVSLLNGQRVSLFDYLTSAELENCSIQWFIAFLSRLGHRWIRHTEHAFHEKNEGHVVECTQRKVSQKLGFLALLHVTHSADYDHESLLAPSNHLCSTVGDIGTNVFSVKNMDALPYRAMQSNDSTLDFGNRRAIQDAFEALNKSLLNELDPGDREAVNNIEPGQISCFARLLEVEVEKPMRKTSGSGIHLNWEDRAPCLDIFLYQLGYNSRSMTNMFFENLPVSKQFLNPLLLTDQTSTFVDARGPPLLQASIHVDNILAMDAGSELEEIFGNDLVIAQYLNVAEEEVFLAHYRLEMLRFQHGVCMGTNAESISHHFPRFIGCILETCVRTELSISADMAIEKSDMSSAASSSDEIGTKWTPRFPTDVIQFLCSSQLSQTLSDIEEKNKGGNMVISRGISLRLLWEVQDNLRTRLVEERRGNFPISPNSLVLMMLCVLGFPALKVEPVVKAVAVQTVENGDVHVDVQTESEYANPCSMAAGNVMYNLRAVRGPQDLVIELRLDLKTRKAQLRMKSCSNDGDDSRQFFWQAWKDAFMGRLCAQGEWRSSHLSSNDERCQKVAMVSKLSHPCEEMDNLGLERPSFWKIWPPHLLEIGLDVRRGIKYEQWRRQINEYKSALDNISSVAELEFKIQGALSSNQDKDIISTTVTERNRSLDTSVVTKEEEVFRASHDKAPDHLTMTSGSDEKSRVEQDDGLLAAAEAACQRGHNTKAFENFLECFTEYRHTESLLRAASLVENIEQAEKFTSSLYTTWRVQPDFIWALDVEKLGYYLDVMYEVTSHGSALLLKGIMVFHRRAICAKVDERAIHAFETFRILYQDTGPAGADVSLYLGISYLYNYRLSGYAQEQEISTNYFVNWAKMNPAVDEVNIIAFLLEKGMFYGRDVRRMNSWSKGGGRDLKKMIKILFLPAPVDLGHIRQGSNHLPARFSCVALTQSNQTEIAPVSHQGLDSSHRCLCRQGSQNGLPNNADDFIPRSNGLIVNLEAAIELYEQIAEKGNENSAPRALNRLAYLHLVGEGIPRNFEKAASYLQIVFNTWGNGQVSRRRRNQIPIDNAMCNMAVLKSIRDFGNNYPLEEDQIDIFRSEILGPLQNKYAHTTAMNNAAVLLECKTRETRRAACVYKSAIGKDISNENPVLMYNYGVSLKWGDPYIRDVARANELFDLVLEKSEDLLFMDTLHKQVRRAKEMGDEDLQVGVEWCTRIEGIEDCAALVKVVDKHAPTVKLS